MAAHLGAGAEFGYFHAADQDVCAGKGWAFRTDFRRYDPGADVPEFDFEPDTLIISRDSKYDLFANEKFNRIYENSPLVSEHLLYTGKLPKQIQDLDVMVSSRVPAGKAVVMQRNIAGFIMDELPLTVTPMYRVEEKKFSRADVQRASGVGLDQPKAIAVLDGV